MNRREQWVSLKIVTADATTSQRSRELQSLQFLQEYGEGRPASKYIVSLLDDFIHQGPNGTHQCLVFELLGPSVGKVIDDYRSFGDTLEMDIILRMSEQLLEAISFIHKAGMGHGGKSWSPLTSYHLRLLVMYITPVQTSRNSHRGRYKRRKHRLHL